MRADGDEQDSPPGPDEDARPAPPRSGFLHRLENRPGLSALVALASFAALGVGVLAAVPDWRDMLSSGDPPPAVQALRPEAPSSYPVETAAVRALDLVVRDPLHTGEPDDPDAPLTPPAVEITVHNSGTRRSVITRVGITVEDTAVISQCGAQGNSVPVSATYDVVLPPAPAAGDVFRVPVSQQQAADEADRFALLLGTSERATPTAVHLYRLRFDLEADGSRTRIPAGTAVVTLPLSLREGDGYFWSEIYDSGEATVPDSPGVEETVACLRDNSRTIKRVLGSGAELSPKLAKAAPTLR
ncbi:hypothetical protein [Nucisporomicrobium flavum]|uniref:hypothetical protein n=1 Tax=Nucisporomicrobium flavum TaxID=2785915 RepID=UPI0018F653D4|nr:hypothetical protein [Nucisporomicrobium flavum]